jgi:hypothetical protein
MRNGSGGRSQSAEVSACSWWRGVVVLLALATPVLASTPAPTPRLETRTDGQSALTLPGTHVDGGAARAASPQHAWPSAPQATARVHRASATAELVPPDRVRPGGAARVV